ncbi:Electron transfer flavoprotein subunit alpha [compost metagenome]
MTVLVIAEHEQGEIKSATLHSISAALQISHDVHLLVAGEGAQDACSKASKIRGVAKVLRAEGSALAHGLAENAAGLVVSLASPYSHFVFNATSEGKSIAPRVAALLDVAQLSDIIKVVDAETFERPIYAGNALATVQSLDSKKVVTVRATAFEPVAVEGGDAAIEDVASVPDSGKSIFVGTDAIKSDRPELTSARIIVSGGRALGSSQNYQSVLTPLAEKLGAALGASRAAVDSGYAPNDLQVGQTGKIVAPDLYIAIGISGAIQHIAGMKDSKVIVAINKDPDAPIFTIADYGLVGDLFEVVPEIASAI